MTVSARWCGLLALSLLVACEGDASKGGGAASAASKALVVEAPSPDEAPDAGGPQNRGAAKAASERVKIAAGEFLAGSTPGDSGRDPVLEPTLLQVELERFEIDRLPYPNDPRKPPQVAVSRERAAALCAERSGRLCTELEWEYACRGPKQQAYAGGERWNSECGTRPETCASGFGVLAMGGAMREWTASDVMPVKRLQARAAAVRGAALGSANVDHRCAHRMAVAADTEVGDLGFRCCYGEENEASIVAPRWLPAFRKVEFPLSRVREIFGSIKRLSHLSEGAKYFREEAAITTVQQRGEKRGQDAGTIPPNTYLTAAPLKWNPVPGEEIVLLTGQAGKDSFIVALYLLPDDRYRLGSSMWMKGELGPVVFIYNPYVRRKLQWASCWECYGETGNISYRADNRVVITQK